MINPSVEISLCWRAILGALRAPGWTQPGVARERLSFILAELRILREQLRLASWQRQYARDERKRRPK